MAEFNQSFTGGAVDLAALAQQAQARREMEGTAFEPFITVSERDVEAKAFERSMQVPVVLLVGSSRSAESEALKATLQQLAQGQREFLVAYLDADASPQLAQALGVRAVPTAVALAAGRPVTSFEGNQPEEQLRQWVDALVSQIGPQLQGLGTEEPEGAAGGEGAQAGDPRLDAAEAALAAGDYDAAAAAYDDILAADPQNAEVKQAKATVAVIKRLDPLSRSTDPIQDAAADPQDVAKQLAAADAEVVAGAPELAFDRLLALVKAHPEAKARLIELFGLFDPADPRVIAARTKLASALF
ncbi:tetratricopeptide repeat protein [Corynebacterium bouchesdurhonense]|uniref:tetratricopeptide repeat protein n=1 Tax=Corynebacterium bouchesdurhonense TaxID=1720192 RepID=UPI0008324035|nr:tetratricopeptide repeat protein [Corynebacterium bouchesdurhonense]